MCAHDVLNLAGLPRQVPVLVRLRILFGGRVNQFGWLLLGFGLIFVWRVTVRADLTSWYHFGGQLETAEGRVLHSDCIDEGGWSRGRHGSTYRRPCYAYYYSFAGSDGGQYKQVSYKRGQKLLNIGEKVTVEYPQGKPQISRIKDMQRRPVGLSGVVPIVFPLLGLCLIIAGIRKAIKACRLLAIGEQATGRLKSKVKTSMTVGGGRHGRGGKPVYKLTFEFTTPQGHKYHVLAKTHEVEKFEDEAEEPLLYDPMCPSYGVMLDDLPGGPRIAENGNIRVRSPVNTIKSLIIPLATVVGHGIYGLYIGWNLFAS